MRKTAYLLVVLYVFLFVDTGVSQSTFREFRELENRVRYENPDSLYLFSESLDTTLIIDKAIYYWALGKSHFWNSDYPKAYAQLDEAAQLIKGLNDKTLLAELYLDLSSSLALVDKNGRALSFALEANELLKVTGSKEQKTRAAISLGEVYRKIGQHDEALKVLKKTLPKTADLSYNKARCLNRMAAVYSEVGKSDTSIEYSNRALDIAYTIGEPDLIATSENEIGYVLRQKDKFKESLLYFFRADSIWRSIGMLRHAANPMHHISIVYRSINEVEKGLDFTQQAYSLIKGKGWHQIEMNLLDDLKMSHAHLGNKDSVLIYDNMRLEATNSFRMEQYEVNTRMVEVMFTQKENERTIREQEVLLENEVLENEAINRERTFLWITLSLIGIILTIIFIYANKQRKLKIQLSHENTEKESKNEQLTVALQANEALVQEISHRVKNNLAVLSGLLTMQANRSENQKVIKELKDSVLRIESIATIHKKLYDKRPDAQVNLKAALEELSGNILAAMGKNATDSLVTEIDDCEADIADAVTLSLIINEVITNSCKYGGVNKNNPIRVELVNGRSQIRCRVIDHGTGFDINRLETNTQSLGLYLIQLLAKQLKAKISWKKTPESFIFTIELNKDE